MARYRFTILPALLFAAQCSFAAEPPAPFENPEPEFHWLQLRNAHGLVTNLPASSREELSHRLVEFRANLRRRKVELDLAEEDGRFDVKDAVITAVLPGGLLYAAFRAQQHQQIQGRQLQMAEQMQDLQQDLIAFGVMPSESLMAAANHSRLAGAE